MAERYALLLIDHGSRREEANALLGEMADIVKSRLPADVHVEIAHMEFASPTVDEAIARCVAAGATLVIAHPFMLAAGLHASETIPELVRAAAEKHEGVRVELAAPLGAHPGLADAVVARYDAAKAAASGDEH